MPATKKKKQATNARKPKARPWYLFTFSYTEDGANKIEAVVARNVDEARAVSDLEDDAEIIGMKREVEVNIQAVEFAVMKPD